MNIDILEQLLEENKIERETKITSLVTLTTRYILRSDDESLLITSSFPLIYAEWEAFFVFAIRTYFNEIDRLAINPELMHPLYYVHNTELEFKQFMDYPSKDKLKQKYRFITNLKPYLNSNPIILNKEVNTESNLGFQTLNSLLKLYNMEPLPDMPCSYDAEKFYKSELNKFLLHKRNAVAHGDSVIVINKDDLTRAKNLIFDLMDITKNRVLDAALNDKYLKPANWE